jgi:hypothetical protein
MMRDMFGISQASNNITLIQGYSDKIVVAPKGRYIYAMGIALRKNRTHGR